MPWNDWQFWVVTSLALAGLGLVLRPLLPSRSGSGRCGTCPSGTKSKDPSAGKRTTLTVEGRRVD